MKTIGKLIKEARIKKRYSLKKVEEETKIKREFIEGIEKENWKVLPDFPVVSGFVKNLASFLKVNEKVALAILRRDYPPRPVNINPKPDVGNEFIWSPRLTFLAGVGIVLVVILGYLAFQYFRFVSPPTLSLYQPKEGQVVSQKNLLVSGKTDTDATVLVNNQPVLTDESGNFSTTMEITQKTTEIEVKATSRSGREATIRRKIIPEFK